MVAQKQSTKKQKTKRKFTKKKKKQNTFTCTFEFLPHTNLFVAFVINNRELVAALIN